jgi:hypothetical protein
MGIQEAIPISVVIWVLKIKVQFKIILKNHSFGQAYEGGNDEL